MYKYIHNHHHLKKTIVGKKKFLPRVSLTSNRLSLHLDPILLYFYSYLNRSEHQEDLWNLHPNQTFKRSKNKKAMHTWKTLILQSSCISPPWLSVRSSSYSALNIQSTEMLLRWMRPNPRKNPQPREPHPKSLTLSVGTEQRLSTKLHSIRRTGIPCASQTINTYCTIWKITFFWGISQTRS